MKFPLDMMSKWYEYPYWFLPPTVGHHCALPAKAAQRTTPLRWSARAVVRAEVRNHHGDALARGPAGAAALARRAPRAREPEAEAAAGAAPRLVRLVEDRL